MLCLIVQCKRNQCDLHRMVVYMCDIMTILNHKSVCFFQGSAKNDARESVTCPVFQSKDTISGEVEHRYL